ncbi:hypothetical protein [Thalassobacillus pellis]|uniref:hypothetical protein n=1 Tax=Thalassobacillus pellis TaxID=748008 RepID=UPI001960A300|nr:hypothetical protein [Thalassobacillus pellis]MBM7554020.1 hypothetical protein [Thalassobacillus pellis]
MKTPYIILFVFLYLVAFTINIFGLMRLYPLYVTSPVLFLLIYIFIKSLLHRRRFKGFD